MAATTGFGNVSRRRSVAFIVSISSKVRAASSLVVRLISVRLPPAKKVFLPLATTTPVTSSTSAYSRSTAAAIDRW